MPKSVITIKKTKGFTPEDAKVIHALLRKGGNQEIGICLRMTNTMVSTTITDAATGTIKDQDRLDKILSKSMDLLLPKINALVEKGLINM